jgi:hypothetical protein
MTLFGTCYLGTSIRPTPSALLTRPRFKIGITRRKVDQRWGEIRNSLPGEWAFSFLYFWGLWPEFPEALVKRLFRAWRVKHRGSGSTEYFAPPLLLAWFFILAVAIILLAWCILSLALALAAVGGVALTLIYLLA